MLEGGGREVFFPADILAPKNLWVKLEGEWRVERRGGGGGGGGVGVESVTR